MTDGAVSSSSRFNPSRPTLLYATLVVNHLPIQTLIDTGASATCVSSAVLRRASHFRFIDHTPRWFVLADGTVPLRIDGLVELTLYLDHVVLHFYAFVTASLCVDLVLGMDFLLAFQACIDVSSQLLSIVVDCRRCLIPLDDHLRRPLLPVRSCSATLIPPFSTVFVAVSAPVSSLAAYFLPTSSFLHHPCLSSPYRTLRIQGRSGSLPITNSSASPQSLPASFCFGYLLSTHQDNSRYFSHLAAVCRAFNARHPYSAPLSLRDVPARSSPTRPPTSSRRHCFTAFISSMPPSPSFHLQQTIDRLSLHIAVAADRRPLSSLLTRYCSLFDNSRHNISTLEVRDVFHTVPHSPPAFRPHRNPHHYQETRRLIDEFLEAGIIRESTSPYAAPGFLVPRKDNRPGRLVVDYRALNRVTIPDASPLPHAEDLLQELGRGYRFFSKLDLKSGYHQFRIPPEDRPKTAFVVSQGHYEFLVLSMGPQNAPAAFQRTMCNVLKSCRDFSQVFLDDIVVFSKTFVDHLAHLRLIFAILADHHLVLNASKCELAVESVVVLGHHVSSTGITPTTDAIDVILNLPEPRTLKQANKFLGALAYYRKFVPNFAHVAAPIHRITNLTSARRHLFRWSSEHSAAFRQLKHILTTAPLFLRFPLPDFPLHLATDASGIATGGVLYQEVGGTRHNLFYHSKLLSPVEQSYSVPEKEALAIFHCLQRMRGLILGRQVFIHTDHCPICNMLQKPVNNRRIERVANLIQEYQIAGMKHVSGKSNCLPDFLSRPFDDPLFDVPYGLESKLSSSTAIVLPASSPSLPRLNAMTLRPRKRAVPPSAPVANVDFDSASAGSSHSFLSPRSVSDFPLTTNPSPNVFSASNLAFEQANDPTIRRIRSQLALSSTTSSTFLSSFLIQDDLLHKLVFLPSSSAQPTAVPFLPSSMIKSLLVSLHDDPYQGGHFSVDKMFSKISSRFWWPRMRCSIQHHVRACRLCQQFNYSRQKAPGHLHPIPPTAIPFAIIGMDFCGPFVTSSRENKYILVVTDLFTRFVVAVPLPTNTAHLTALSLFREVFCKFGICTTLITDQGSHFNNLLMKALAHLLGYNHILSTPYHPQTNGVVERFNASVVVQLSKLHQRHHNNWDDYLDPVVFAYNSAKHKTTQFSPFELLFGRSPRLPIDSPSRCFSLPRSHDWFRHIQQQLDVYHQTTHSNIIAQQRSNKLRYDTRRADPHYRCGDRVFVKVFSARSKLDPRFSADPNVVVHPSHPSYRVRNLRTGVTRSYHVADLRPVVLSDDTLAGL